MIRTRRWVVLRAAWLLAVAGAGASCAPTRPADGGGAVARGPAPGYAETAAAYNARVAGLDRLFASTVLRITYDEEGERKTEQGEGTLQLVKPGSLALSINKAGKRLFWFGCDGDRYWWFDLVEGRTAYIGRLDRFDRSRAAYGAAGLALHPPDLVRLLGVSPLPIGTPGGGEVGATQWSGDGRLLGATAAVEGGFQRVWMDPVSREARRIELYDAQKRLVLGAGLEGYDTVELRQGGTYGARMATRIRVEHAPSGTLVRLTLAGVEGASRQIKPVAFDFEEIARLLRPERVVNLDAPRGPAGARAR